jgi:myo-inositol-1(or 4)-monophosphatase
VLDVIVEAARAAGAGLLRDFARRDLLQIDEKGTSDFVSNADLRAQETISALLSSAYPEYAVVCDVDVASSETDAQRGRFIVDPLDGTTNFLRGMPHFAVSIALEIGGETVAGAVLDVAKNELFWAEAGRGAWLGDTRLAVAPDQELERAVIGTGIPHAGRSGHGIYLEALGNIMPEVAGIRRLGAAALDLAYVAAGRFDAFFERGLAPWDVAAGALLVREAGGKVTQTDGTRLLTSRDILATRGEPLHARVVDMLAPLQGAATGHAATDHGASARKSG